MRFFACLTLILLLSKQSITQDSPFVINPGARIDEAVHSKELYQYPDFTIGKIYFRDTRVVQARMNYNRLTEEMFFIGASGDTLVLDDAETIRVINIEKDSFYFNQGYILVVQSNNSMKLGAKNGYRPSDKKKPTSYYMMSKLSSVSSLSSFEVGSNRYGLVAKEQLVFYKTVQYYFGDKFGHFLPASQKNLAKMFSKYNSEIKKYCSQNKINFDKKADLEKILAFVEATCQ